MNMRPLGGHLIVKGLSAEEVSKSGIIIPDTVNKERSERGEVVAVGPGKLMENGSRAPMDVKPGDNIVFKKYAPDEVKIDGKEYLVISIDDVIAVIE